MIAASVLGSGIAAIDSTVVGIALPAIGRDFHTGVSALQWVVTGYLLTLASLLLVGGSLSDRFGRRRLFQIGVVWFAVASAGCGLAPDAGFLIGMRVLQGVGGALLAPGSLAILQASFASEDRARAIGAWSGLGGVATAVGPLLGGYLISAASWRWIFFLNVPVSAVVLFLTARHVPESRDASVTGRIDFAGAVFVTVGLGSVTFFAIEGPTLGWTSGSVLTAIGLALFTIGAFIATERRSAEPMLPLEIFRLRQFGATNAVTFVLYAALGGALFLLPVELELALKYSPLDAGAALLPVTVIMLIFSARSGRLASQIGPRAQMSAGPLVVGAGLALLTRISVGQSYFVAVLPAVVVLGIGLATTVAPLTATAMGAVPGEHAGLASAVNNDVARAGGLIAVAILPAIAGITGSVYLDPAKLAAGFRAAMTVSAAACGLAGLMAAVTIVNPSREDQGGECHHCGLDGPPLLVRDRAGET